VFHCAIKRRIKDGRAKETGKTGRRRRPVEMQRRRREVEGSGPDARARPVSERRRGKKKWATGGVLGRKRESRPRGVRWAAGFGPKGRGGLGFCLFIYFFFQTFFKPFQTHISNFEIELFSKHSKIFKIFLKSFKISHKQIIKPCIQNMMHKHLLLLNY
jgi:hypothetical protein